MSDKYIKYIIYIESEENVQRIRANYSVIKLNIIMKF